MSVSSKNEEYKKDDSPGKHKQRRAAINGANDPLSPGQHTVNSQQKDLLC
jgi:hypothetical protein